MSDYILQNKTGVCGIKSDSRRKNMEFVSNIPMEANSQTDTSSSHSGSSEFGSYCELACERQNSQNEDLEKGGLNHTEVLGKNEIYSKRGPERSESTESQCKESTESTVLTIETRTENTHNKSKKSNASSINTFSSNSTISRTKHRRSWLKSCCCCKVVIPATVSLCVSAIVTILFLLNQSQWSVIVRHDTTQRPKFAKSTAEELRNYSGLQSLLTTKRSRAQLYLDQNALKEEKKLLWTATDLQDAFISSDLSTSMFGGTYGCLVVSEEGFYSVFSKITFFYNRDTTDPTLYHSTNLLRDGNSRRQLSINKYTPPPKETRPEVGNNFWPSILPGYYHLKPNDKVCILVSNIERVYAGPTYSFFSMYMLNDD